MDDLEQAVAASPLVVHAGPYDVVRLSPHADLGGLRPFALMRDAFETTVIARPEQLADLRPLAREPGFALLEVRVVDPFETPGFVAAISSAIAAVGVSLLVVSTFSIDYVLVRTRDLDAALRALADRGLRTVA
jgi:uncharacterized protein